MPKRSSTGFTLIEIMVVVAMIATILAIAIPNFIGSSEKSREIICIANLTEIDKAIDQWVLQENISPGTAISESEVVGNIQGASLDVRAAEFTFSMSPA